MLTVHEMYSTERYFEDGRFLILSTAYRSIASEGLTNGWSLLQPEPAPPVNIRCKGLLCRWLHLESDEQHLKNGEKKE